MTWVLAAFRKYATFSGRAQRSEYWYFILFYLLVYFALIVAAVIAENFSGLLGGGLQLLAAIFSLGAFIPSLAVSCRRLHDTDRSGWWFLIVLIPLIGGLVLFVFFVQDSQPGENRFGPSPKGNTDAKGGGVSMAVIAGVVGLFAVAIIGMLAAVAIPAYQDYNARVTVAQAVGILAGFKPQIAELVKRNDAKASLASAGISPPGKDIVGGIYYDPKTLTLVANLAEPFKGKSVGLQHGGSGGDSPSWICGSKNLEMKFLPSSCRRQMDYLDEREALAFQQVAPTSPAPAASAPAAAEAKAPATPQAHAVPAVAQPVAPAVSPPRAESTLPKAVAPAPVAASPARPEARIRAASDAELIAQRRAAMLREEEAQRRLKPKQSACVYKPVMTDEDLARCR